MPLTPVIAVTYRCIAPDLQLDGPGPRSAPRPGVPSRKLGPTRSNGGSLLARRVTARQGPVRPYGPRIAGLAVSDPGTVFCQEQVLRHLGLEGDTFAEGIFERCGVERRQLQLSEDFLARTLQERSQDVEDELLRRSIQAIDALQLDVCTIGTVLSASLYSLGCPTLAHRLVDHYDMDPATDKYHITGVGCASGVPLMRLAAQAMGQRPGSQALVVAAESMSSMLTRSAPGDSKAKIVGSAIFGDGCAAALLSNDPLSDGPTILASQVHQIGATLDAVSLKLTPDESYLHLARDLPELAGAGLPAVADEFLRRNDLDRSRIDHWIVHPGGRRIIENVQSALELSDDDVVDSWRVLADHGNIGTPSILYVLRDTIERCEPRPGARGLMVTIGPGVAVGLMLLGW